MASFNKNLFKPEFKKDENKDNTRTIGLEIEGKIKRDQFHPFGNTVYDNTANIDNEDDSYYNPDEPHGCTARAKYCPEVAAIGFDGDGVEFALQPMSIGCYKDGGTKNFKAAMKFLKENLLPRISTNSGTHINISFYENEDDEHTYDNVYWLIANFAIQFQKIAGRVTHWARIFPYSGEKATKIKVLELSEYRTQYVTKTTKPNTVKKPSLDSYAKHNAIVNKSGELLEFRMFKSTNNIREAIAWVELCHNTMEIAAKGELRQTKFSDLIKGQYINDYVRKLRGNRKLTPEELEATVETQFELRMYDSDNTIIL